MNKNVTNQTSGAMTVNDVLNRDLTFRYQLLGRLEADCEYYLNYGNRNTNRLWAGNEAEQIELMTKLYDSFSEEEKPQWLTKDKIKKYAKEMLPTEE